MKTNCRLIPCLSHSSLSFSGCSVTDFLGLKNSMSYLHRLVIWSWHTSVQFITLKAEKTMQSPKPFNTCWSYSVFTVVFFFLTSIALSGTAYFSYTRFTLASTRLAPQKSFYVVIKSNLQHGIINNNIQIIVRIYYQNFSRYLETK